MSENIFPPAALQRELIRPQSVEELEARIVDACDAEFERTEMLLCVLNLCNACLKVASRTLPPDQVPGLEESVRQRIRSRRYSQSGQTFSGIDA